MIIKVLQKKIVHGNTWMMCVGNLYDYLSTLNKDFYEYQIQRRIVRNIYLDKLVILESIKKIWHIQSEN